MEAINMMPPFFYNSKSKHMKSEQQRSCMFIEKTNNQNSTSTVNCFFYKHAALQPL